MKTIVVITALAAGVLFGGVWWSNSLAVNNPDIVTQSALHWHPVLSIYVKGVQQQIPAEIGIGAQYAGTAGYDPQMQMAAVHTHDASGTIHFEFMSGPVHKEDLTLGQFFKIWGKEMNSFGSNTRMTVNGKENTEYANYVMREGDKIELHYE